ncbi:helix-turn-helix domain-containing protein [Undibacterium sp. Dicai25W]|uniref:helix-turn-helix domain-containing protein n=1 Tax=Undibacterium sp. Dicai25W TaxID=3413034 RepID=UPI003BF0CB36
MRLLNNSNSVGSRLKSERERLGLTQAGFAKKIEVGRLSVMRYEIGDRCPNADYLIECEKIGVDIYFVLSGSKSEEKIDFQCMRKAVGLMLEMIRDLGDSADARVMTTALIHFYRSILNDQSQRNIEAESKRIVLTSID